MIQNEQIEALQQIAAQTLELAKQQGADAAEIDAHFGQGMSVTILNQQIDNLEYDRAKELTLTVYIGKKRGSASTNDFSLPSMKKVVAAAYDFATYAAEDPYSGLPEREQLAFNPPQLEQYFPWKDLTAAAAIEKMQACEAHALALNSAQLKSDGAGLSSHQTYELIANSTGFMQGFSSTSHSMYCALIAEKSGEMQRDSEFTCAMDAADLWSTEVIAAAANRRACARLGARQIPTQSLPVLFIDHAASAFWKYLIAAAMGGNIHRRSSFLLDRLGQEILPNHISLQENPFLPKGIGSSPFDDDGVYTRNKIFIEQGRLNTYFLSTYSGRQLGLPTTGNAGGIYNMMIDTPQAQPLADIIAGLDRGLIVTETLGQGVNLVTGDYSKGIVGFYVKHGKIQFPVEEVTIAGNLLEMYRHIIAVGTEKDYRYNILTGAILVDSMMVAGN